MPAQPIQLKAKVGLRSSISGPDMSLPLLLPPFPLLFLYYLEHPKSKESSYGKIVYFLSRGAESVYHILPTFERAERNAYLAGFNYFGEGTQNQCVSARGIEKKNTSAVNDRAIRNPVQHLHPNRIEQDTVSHGSKIAASY